jgi:hypothetical protein
MSSKKPGKHPVPKSSKRPARGAAKRDPKTPRRSKAPAVETAPATPKASPFTRDPRLPAVGTTIERPYKGKVLQCEVLEGGFRFDGREFRSLSAAAQHATGAKAINGFLFWNLIPGKATTPRAASAERAPRGKKRPDAPKIGGDGNDVATPEGQRAALREAGLSKPATDSPAPAKPTRGTPEQVSSIAKARAARAAKVAARKAKA